MIRQAPKRQAPDRKPASYTGKAGTVSYAGKRRKVKRYMAAITKNRDIMRLELGDTDEDAPLFTDEELEVFLTRYDLTGSGTGGDRASLKSATADACEALANRFATEFDFAEDGQSFSRSQKSAAYMERARELRDGTGGSGGYSVPLTSSVVTVTQT